MFRLWVLVVIAGLVAENIREVLGTTDPPETTDGATANLAAAAAAAAANIGILPITLDPPGRLPIIPFPPGFPCYHPVQTKCWTQWFDRDDPSGTGDWETLDRLRKEYPGKICPTPVDIQVQRMNGLPGDVIHAQDTTTGFICRNRDQAPGWTCSDFRVRFSCHPPFCGGGVCWTGWYDRDDPSGTGDWELLSYLRSGNPGQICANPLYIEVVTRDTEIPAVYTREVFYTYNPTQGFVCRNKDQKDGFCKDYKVRFGCACAN